MPILLVLYMTLQEKIDEFGRENLIPIDFIKQQLFYARHGCQPVFIWEKENQKGKITCWYLKKDTKFAKSEWDKTKPAQ